MEADVELDPGGRNAVGLALDVRDEDAFVRVRGQRVERWGAVRVLVSKAGQSKVEFLMRITPESFGSVVATGLNGTFFGCQVFGECFAECGFGRIVTIG